MGKTQINQLLLDFNQLVGTVPSELGLISSLRKLLMSFVVCDVMVAICCRNTDKRCFVLLFLSLEYFDFSNNLLTGTLPQQLCHVGTRLSCNAKLQCSACACDCILSVNGDTGGRPGG